MQRESAMRKLLVLLIALIACCSVWATEPFNTKPSPEVTRLTGAEKYTFVIHRRMKPPYFAATGVDAKGNLVVKFEAAGKKVLLERFEPGKGGVAVERVATDASGRHTVKKVSDPKRFMSWAKPFVDDITGGAASQGLKGRPDNFRGESRQDLTWGGSPAAGTPYPEIDCGKEKKLVEVMVCLGTSIFSEDIFGFLLCAGEFVYITLSCPDPGPGAAHTSGGTPSTSPAARCCETDDNGKCIEPRPAGGQCR